MLWISLLLLCLANPVLPLFQVLLVSPALGLTPLFLATWDSYREALTLLLPHLFLLIPPLLPFSFSAGLRQTSVTVLSRAIFSHLLFLTATLVHCLILRKSSVPSPNTHHKLKYIFFIFPWKLFQKTSLYLTYPSRPPKNLFPAFFRQMKTTPWFLFHFLLYALKASPTLPTSFLLCNALGQFA